MQHFETVLSQFGMIFLLDGGESNLTKAESALKRLREWKGNSEADLYPYIKEFFVEVLGYPREAVKINISMKKGIPDVVLISKDSTSKSQIAWVSAEAKKEPNNFRDANKRQDVVQSQLRRYVAANTVYALLIDPTTIAVYLPDLSELRIAKLDELNVQSIVDPSNSGSLAFLSYQNSVSEHSLTLFREGKAPTSYLSVETPEGRDKFHEALGISARELVTYATSRLESERVQYNKYSSELSQLKPLSSNSTSLRLQETKLRQKYANAVLLFESVLPDFERQLGRQAPSNANEANKFLSEVFATEAASLVLSRIIFIRYAEDHSLTTRKISNGGIKAYREFYNSMKDDYRWLLKSAYEDAKLVYERLFEESIFDWAHKGNGELSRILERIFYRLNAFDFKEISGDILGNLYEAFLDKARRKKLGEYYTKSSIVKFILDEVGFERDPSRLLDPACGSGSFLVQAAKKSIDAMISRRITPKEAIRSTLELVHGLDINVFASFISQLQILWSVFPYLESNRIHKLPELQVYGGLNSLEYDVQLTLGEAVTSPLERNATLTRDSKYRYVVGNPPYIRNERLKDKGPWRDFYKVVDIRNSDIAFFFVQRALLGGKRKTDIAEEAMPSWLEDKGVLSFVLSLGFANSAAALPLRQLLLKYKIIQLVDLELVAYRLFDADIVPMLVSVQKEQPPLDWKVTVRVVDPSHVDEAGNIDVSKAQPYQIDQSFLAQNPMNPFGYFLTKVRGEDFVVMKKLFSQGHMLSQYALPLPRRGIDKDDKDVNREEDTNGDELKHNVALMFGMKLGSGQKIKESRTTNSYQILKGSDIATYYVEESASEGWVDPKDVEGKSIWGHLEGINDVAYVLSEISVAPTCARFNPKEIAFNNSAIVVVPNNESKDFPWDVYLNSALVRFIHHVSLRTTVLLRRRSTLYPRTVGVLPVADSLFDNKEQLSEIAHELRKLSSAIKRRWDLINETIRSANKRRLSTFGALDFSTWSEPAIGQLTLTKIQERDALTMVDEEGQTSLLFLEAPLPLLKVVKYLLSDDEDAEVTPSKLQSLEVPLNYEEIAKKIDDAENPDSPEINRFSELSDKADRVVEQSFGLDNDEQHYIHRRLTEYPLSLLQPRYPWTAGAHHQKTRQYVSKERYA